MHSGDLSARKKGPRSKGDVATNGGQERSRKPEITEPPGAADGSGDSPHNTKGMGSKDIFDKLNQVTGMSGHGTAMFRGCPEQCGRLLRVWAGPRMQLNDDRTLTAEVGRGRRNLDIFRTEVCICVITPFILYNTITYQR